MASSDNRDEYDLAGEYVLGTLDEAERVAVEARLLREPALAAAIAEWQEKLSPLDEVIQPVEPPTGQLNKIFVQIDGQGSQGEQGDGAQTGAEVIQLRGQVTKWRFASIASGALAAALALFMVFGNITSPRDTGAPQMVALLESADSKLAYVASINTESGLLLIKRHGLGPATGKSHQLWAIGGGRAKPESLGVINASAEISIGRISPAKPDNLGGVTLAISLEPPGGSPTGQPTGPVLFSGKFIGLPEV